MLLIVTTVQVRGIVFQQLRWVVEGALEELVASWVGDDVLRFAESAVSLPPGYHCIVKCRPRLLGQQGPERSVDRKEGANSLKTRCSSPKLFQNSHKSPRRVDDPLRGTLASYWPNTVMCGGKLC